MSESLALSFTKMVSLIDNETKFLKGISNLRGADSEVKDKLTKIDSFVTSLENNLDAFEDFIDEELAALSAMERLGEQSELQQADVEDMKENIPHFLNTQSLQQGGRGQNLKKDPLELISDNHASQGQEKVQKAEKSSVSFASSVPPTPPPTRDFTFITSDELEAVPKSTRSRLTLAQVTNALRTLVSLVGDKNKLLSKTWKQQQRLSQANKLICEEYKQLRCDEHGQETFLTEREVRASSVFGAGEASGRAMLVTLRALRRLRQVRSKGETTYIILHQ